MERFQSFKESMLWCVTIGLGILACMSASATEVGDKDVYSKLRQQYIDAIRSNEPANIGKVLSEDFVLMQPDKHGPDTYGREAHVQYRKSLPKITDFKVEPVRVISCGTDWALEIGKEHATWITAQMEFSTSARYFKLLNRSEKHGWQYARVFMAWAPESLIRPPAPGFITNRGWGSWEARKQSPEATAAALAQQKDMYNHTRNLIAAGDMSEPFEYQISPFDETTGEPISYGPEYEMHGLEDHLAARQYMNLEAPDLLLKVPAETIVCEPDTAFSWGKSLYGGQNKVTGEYDSHMSEVMYMHRKYKGNWKVGPAGLTQ